MIILRHCMPGGHNHFGYSPVCAWPEDCQVQWGARGIVLRREDKGGNYETAFFESFPKDPQTFIRGEGVTIEEAEIQAFQAFQKYQACQNHEFERRGYTNGAGFCIHCNLFNSQAFEPIPRNPNAPKSLIEDLLEKLVKEI